MDWHLDHTFADDLPQFCHPWRPADVVDPELVVLNDALAADLGLDPAVLRTDSGVDLLCGRRLADGSQPVAQAYAGHQFGHFNPMLGDGRAVLLGELATPTGHRRDIALKGSGRTPFSRGGDGRLQLGPALREYLMGEALHALDIPTTRVLAVVATGDTIARPTGPQPGAVLVRVASSHLRVGTVEWGRAHGSVDDVAAVVRHAAARHYPELADDDFDGFLSAVVSQQARLIAQWMAIGFIHGVMNTDNMTLSGETIDFGPCAFLETHSPDQVFSSIDRGGRYAYGQQPAVGLWNLARLAEAMLPLLSGVDDATARVQAFVAEYRTAHAHHLTALTGSPAAEVELALVGQDHASTLRRLGGDRAPAVIPRNHLVDGALSAAIAGDLAPFTTLLDALHNPYRTPSDAILATPAPRGFTDQFVTYCGT